MSGIWPGGNALPTWPTVLPGLTLHACATATRPEWNGAGASDLPRAERLGHGGPGMRGICGHVTPAMRADLDAGPQGAGSLTPGVGTAIGRSTVPVLGALLTRSPRKMC